MCYRKKEKIKLWEYINWTIGKDLSVKEKLPHNEVLQNPQSEDLNVCLKDKLCPF